MCTDQTYLPLLFPNSSSAPYQSPWQPHAHFPFYHFVSKLPLWDPPVLPICMRLCGCLLGNKQSTSGHIPQREWFSLPQQTSTTDRFSDMGRTSKASPPTMLYFFFLWKYRSWACHYGCYVLMHATAVSEKEITLRRSPLSLPVLTSLQFSRVCPWAADGGKLVRLRFSFVEHLE